MYQSDHHSAIAVLGATGGLHLDAYVPVDEAPHRPFELVRLAHDALHP